MSRFHASPGPVVNLLDDLPQNLADERFEPLCELGDREVRIERIISRGHASPEGFWYDQHQDEWVLVLQGEARLAIEGRPDPVVLRAGDSILLPARCRHRVEWTTPDRETIWLAVFRPAP